jgi:hypothetical protein
MRVNTPTVVNPRVRVIPAKVETGRDDANPDGEKKKIILVFKRNKNINITFIFYIPFSKRAKYRNTVDFILLKKRTGDLINF